MTALEEYLEKHMKLVQMFKNGTNDSVEADTLRDSMDDPWRRMTREELAECKRIIKAENARLAESADAQP